MRIGRMRGENDNAEPGAGGPWLPSTLSLFLPTLAVLCGYAVALAALVIGGQGNGALARFCVSVIAIGGPVLAIHALARRLTIRVDLLPGAVRVHPGFPRREAFEIPYPLIRRLSLERGLVGRLAGSGALAFETTGGRIVRASDLARPEEAMTVIGRLMTEASSAALEAANRARIGDNPALSAG